MCKEIRVGKIKVPVTDEVYKVYYMMKRRERYMEEDIKVGRSIVDPETGAVIGYKPSKEDSIQRLMDKGQDFADEKSVEDIVVDKAMLLILRKAMKELDRKDLELIHYIYVEQMTAREAAKHMNSSHVTVLNNRDKLLDKLRKFF